MPAFKSLPHLKGVRVRIKRDIETKSGVKFPKGTICHISYADTRYLALHTRNPDPLNIFGPRHLAISHVERWNIEWLTPDGMEPEDPNKKPKRARRAPEVAPERPAPPPLVDEDDIETALDNLDDD